MRSVQLPASEVAFASLPACLLDEDSKSGGQPGVSDIPMEYFISCLVASHARPDDLLFEIVYVCSLHLAIAPPSPPHPHVVALRHDISKRQDVTCLCGCHERFPRNCFALLNHRHFLCPLLPVQDSVSLWVLSSVYAVLVAGQRTAEPVFGATYRYPFMVMTAR